MIGTTLRNARLAKGLTTSQAALATHIKVQTLDSIENDDFTCFAAPIYGRGFIKIYADYLGTDPTPLIEEYRAHCSPAPVPTLGEDTGGVVELPDHGSEPETVDPEKESWPRFEWPKLNIFRQISLPREPARLKAVIAEEPLKFALVGLGIVVVLVFIVSGVIQLVRPREAGHAEKSKTWDTSAIGKQLPAPYVDADK